MDQVQQEVIQLGRRAAAILAVDADKQRLAIRRPGRLQRLCWVRPSARVLLPEGDSFDLLLRAEIDNHDVLTTRCAREARPIRRRRPRAVIALSQSNVQRIPRDGQTGNIVRGLLDPGVAIKAPVALNQGAANGIEQNLFPIARADRGVMVACRMRQLLQASIGRGPDP
jgi:hypothetical protein